MSYVKGEKKLKFRFDNKVKPMFVLLLFWLVEEFTEDFIYGPFFDALIVLVLCIIIAMGIVQDKKKLIICDKIDCGE